MATGKQRRQTWVQGPPLIIAATLLLGTGCEQASNSSASSAPSSSSSTRSAAGGQARHASSPDTQAREQAAPAASAVDQQYAAILSVLVSEDGLVRYAALAQEPLKGQLDAVVAGYASAPLPSESEVKARLALWCNAYNANMLKVALEESRKEGFTTISDVAGVFDQRQITVAGEATTLDGLKDRLRSLNDPRIHAALVFGAISCPPLRNEPYAADRLDEQLDQQSFAWLDAHGKNRLAQDALVLSRLFEWHAADFAVEPYGGPAGFIRKHARANGLLREFVRRYPEPRIRYADFDWRLNDAGEE